MDIVEKILMCIDYCKEQNTNSNGEILQELAEEDFDDRRAIQKECYVLNRYSI